MKLLSEKRKNDSYNATQINTPPTIGVEISFLTAKSTNESAQVIIAAEMPKINQMLYRRYCTDHGFAKLPLLSKFSWGITNITGTIQMQSTDHIN